MEGGKDMRFLVTLGDFNDEGSGRLVIIDTITKEVNQVVHLVPPPYLRSQGKGFTGATWLEKPGESDLFVAGYCAIFRFDPRDWILKATYHLPCMNDIHNLTINAGRIYFTSTGLDRVDILDIDGGFLGGYDLEPAWVTGRRYFGSNPTPDSWRGAFFTRFDEIENVHTPTLIDGGSPSGEYYKSAEKGDVPFHRRRIQDFIHPNHLSFVDGHLILTRFQDRCLQDLTTWDIIVSELPGFPHDGELNNDRFWITCTNGIIAGYPVKNGRIDGKHPESFDVFECTKHSGWCRGLHVTDKHFIVGLTRITRMPRYRWTDRPFAETETSVLLIDKNSRQLEGRFDLSEFGSHPKVFDIIPLK